MHPDPEIQASDDGPRPGRSTPPLSPSGPPVIGVPDDGRARDAPPSPPALSTRASWSARHFIVILLNLCLGLFLADAMTSLVDDFLVVCFDRHALAAIRGLLFFFSVFAAFAVYCLMGLAPMIPRRIFLPLTLFKPVAGLISLPFLIYFHRQAQEIDWIFSFCQALFGVGILCRLQGGFRFQLPLMATARLEERRFSWRHLSLFAAVNFLVLLPAIAAYLVLCVALAADHFSDGFMEVRRDGLTVRVRKYAREDGKTIQLVPMSHVAEPEFYRELSQGFPTNALILMEGVSDNRHLLTNKISYQRMAASLGVTEQVNEFKPRRGGIVRADLDVEEFTPTTIAFLNLVMLIHAHGVNSDTLETVMQFSPPPHFEEQLIDDILRKRNRRLLKEIDARLPEAPSLIVPWGVAHMPEIAREIQKSGFRLQESREYVAIRFGSPVHTDDRAAKVREGRR